MKKRLTFHDNGKMAFSTISYNALVAAMRRYFPHEAAWQDPEADNCVWVTLPSEVDTRELLEWAEWQGITFVPAEGSHQGTYNALGLYYTHLPVEEIEEGIRRLAEIINKYRYLAQQYREASLLSFVGP
mgnify:CR=1 FL=1